MTGQVSARRIARRRRRCSHVGQFSEVGHGCACGRVWVNAAVSSTAVDGAEHWDHLRTSNPIESVFATVRHRTVRTKGALSQDTARLMVFKLVMAAAKTWRRLKGENQLPKVVQRVTFRNGVEVTNTPAQNAA